MTDADLRQVLVACEKTLGLYEQLRKNPDKKAADDMKWAAERLKNIFAKLEEQGDSLGVAGSRNKALEGVNNVINGKPGEKGALDKIKEKVPLEIQGGSSSTVDEALPPEGGSSPQTASGAGAEVDRLLSGKAKPDDAMEMDDFFETVSTSLMRAQEALNRRSLDYISALDPRFPPAIYGIPSVRAEMRVGFNKTSAKGINLILFSNSSQKAQFGESTISFEVVGTPPPPGPASYGNYVVPVPRFMVVGDRRAEIIARVRADKGLDQTVYANAEEHVLVLRYERAAETDPTRYLILWPAKKADTGFDHWHTLAVVYAVEGRGPDGELLLLYPEAPETPDEKKVESIFEFPPKATKQVLTLNPDSLGKVASVTALSALDKTKLAQLVVNLGDVLMNVNLVLGQWLRAVEYRPPAPQAPGGAGKG